MTWRAFIDCDPGPAQTLSPYAQYTQNTQKPGSTVKSETAPAGFEDIEHIEYRPTEIARPSLHAALAEAAEGLPVTLAELAEAFGEEGRADWLEGYTPHCRPEFLRAFARAVAERLERERAEAPPPPPPGPLDGLPLLREDRRFIEARTRYRRDRAAVLAEYARRWREAADAEPVEIRRANAGRRAANAWLRGLTR